MAISVYHEGERAVQRRAGGEEAAQWGAENAIREELPPVADDFLAAQVVAFAGHRAADGAVWASALGGPPGFVRADGLRAVQIHAVPAGGDALGATLAHGPTAVGLLAIEPATRRRMRVNGTARLDGDGVVVSTEQVYGNCPKYIAARSPEPLPAPAAPPRAVRSEALSPAQMAQIAEADTFYVATSHAKAGADVSHRGGRPGFVTVAGPRRLSWPDYRGNSMYMTLGNLEVDPRAGLLLLDYATGDVLQLTGRARTDWDAERSRAVPGAQRIVDFDVDAVVALPGALGWRWRFETPSKVSPPVAPAPPRGSGDRVTAG